MKPILFALVLSGFIFGAAPRANAKTPTDPKAATELVAPKVFKSPQKVGTRATCPVTGESFVIAKDTVHAEYQGKHVYFCCAMCKKAFDKDPAKYTK
jgi:YHS domain-containing protein